MIKLKSLLKEFYATDYFNDLLQKISDAGYDTKAAKLTPDEKAFMDSFSEKGASAKNVYVPFKYVKIGDLAKYKKDIDATYKIIDKFYGSEYDKKGKKWDTTSTLGFAVDPDSDIAKQHGDSMGGKGEIASFRDMLKNSTPNQLRIAGLEGINFDDMQFVVAEDDYTGRPKIYPYGYPNGLFVPDLESDTTANLTHVVYIDDDRNEFDATNVKYINKPALQVAKAIKRKAINDYDEDDVQAFKLDPDTYFIVISDENSEYAIVGKPKSPRYGTFWNLLDTDKEAASDIFYEMQDVAYGEDSKEI